MHRKDSAAADPRLVRREKSARTPFPLPREPAPPYDDADEGAAVSRARQRAASVSPWLFVMATAINTTVASLLAVVITLGVVNQDRVNQERSRPGDIVPATLRLASVGSEPPPASAAASQRVTLRPIGSPSQPLELEPQRPARFPLQIQPADSTDEPFILALSGTPPGTIIFGGNRISSDTWFLPPGSARRLEIVLPEWSTQVFEVTVELRRVNGVVAAQSKAWFVVPPPAGIAAPAASPPADEAALRELIANADRLIIKGDIVGARALYQRAAELGSATAALALGTTYDPNRLWSLGVLGLSGSKERARQWYLRAAELGNAEAKARLAALGQ
jgi:hypothetical protein